MFNIETVIPVKVVKIFWSLPRGRFDCHELSADRLPQ